MQKWQDSDSYWLEDAEGEERLNINLESLKERATSDPLKLPAPVFQGCTFYRF